MKKKIIGYACLGALVLAIALFGMWYYTPKTFLMGVSSDEVASIAVFDGSTGKHFLLENAEEIQTVVENIQSIETDRDKMSVHYDGIGFSMRFLDADGKEIDTFAINGTDTVRDDPFFYRAKTGTFCIEYLMELEERYAAPREAVEWGISLSAKDVTQSGLTLVCTREQGYAGGDLQTGSYFVVERLWDGRWTEVARLPQEHDVVWTQEAWMIPNNHTLEWHVDWEWLYGRLSEGEYRIGKEIMDFRSMGNFEKAMAYAEFCIS